MRLPGRGDGGPGGLGPGQAATARQIHVHAKDLARRHRAVPAGGAHLLKQHQPPFIGVEHAGVHQEVSATADFPVEHQMRFTNEDRAAPFPPIRRAQTESVEHSIGGLIEDKAVIGDVHMAVVIDPFRADRGTVDDAFCFTGARTTFNESHDSFAPCSAVVLRSAPMATLARPVLAVSRLHRPGLAPASFIVGAGECVVVSGPSGSGKTLLLRAIADLDPNEGEVHLDARPRTAFSAPDWRRQVAYAPAESGWWAERVGDHFAPGETVATLVTAVGLPNEALAWPVSRLSTGERQRLALARLLAAAPRVLLLDEPTSALDPASIDRVEALLRRTLATGAAIVVVTHDPHQIGRLAHAHLEMRGGRLITGDGEADTA